ncbi:uncharacterized protein LOC125769026 [Anopheles funestus]|uniref:uncharacterized protein LOC125769026 n=1 Tax=Anopheles funestus TaxID=62324 RepID=UPI0020C5C162|nr:uncharacterized protein LOC125769026 [Anopheles funestus]
MKVFGESSEDVLVVAVYCGDTKPQSVEEYLRTFVNELNNLQENGIMVNGRRYEIMLRAIIADTPARVFIKGVKSFNSSSGCLKCTVKVIKDRETKRSYYDGINGQPRTDELFKAKHYKTHIKNDTPLTDLHNCDIIKSIIIADDLHLFHYGALRKLLKGFTQGNFGNEPKLTFKHRKEISSFLRMLKLPCEIPRKMRGLNLLKIWKASEFQSFLLYASVEVLKGRITDRAYNHFMLLFRAATFFSSHVYENYWEYAGRLLDLFVEDFPEVYDKTLLSSNIHNLHHVYEDVREFGPLPTISSYIYEGHLQNMKRVTRSKKKCLEQIRNRIKELRYLNSAKKKPNSKFPFIKIKGNNTVMHINRNFILRNDQRNQWFMTKDNSIFLYSSAIETSTGILIQAKKIDSKSISFSQPCPSSYLNIYDANMVDLSNVFITIPVSDVKCKLAAIPKTMTNIMDNISYKFIPVHNTFLNT